MNVDEQRKVRQSRRTAARTIEGRAVVIVIDEQKLHTLNGVGTRVWELADGRSVGAIADQIATEFEVDRAVALRDVGRFVGELEALGALEGE